LKRKEGRRRKKERKKFNFKRERKFLKTILFKTKKN